MTVENLATRSALGKKIARVLKDLIIYFVVSAAERSQVMSFLDDKQLKTRRNKKDIEIAQGAYVAHLERTWEASS